MAHGTKRKKKVIWIVLSTVLIILIGVRLWLPSLVLKEVNQQLQNIEGYDGTVRDIDLSLIAGAYTLYDVELNKTGGKIPVPFFSAERIQLSVEWASLWKGEVVGEIEVLRPILNYVKGPTAASTQTKIDNDWIDVVDKLMPLRINRLEIHEGEIHYRDFHSQPKIDLPMKDVSIKATNLSNVNREQKLLPSTVEARAVVFEGNVNLNMALNPLQRVPAFDLNAELTTINLVNLNPFLRAYGNFDVQKGQFSLYAEAATRDNHIRGYAKPILKDIQVASWKKEEGGLPQRVWETVVGAFSFVLKNQTQDQLATQVNFEGNLQKPDISLWEVIAEILHNAFIRALMPSLEHSVSTGSVSTGKFNSNGVLRLSDTKPDKAGGKTKKKGFLRRMFGNKDKKKKDDG